MKNYKEIIVGTVVFFIAMVAIGLKCYKPNFGVIKDYNTIVHSDTARINLKDQTLLLAFKKDNQSSIEGIQSSMKDSVIGKEEYINMLSHSHQSSEKFIDSIQRMKNMEMFPFKSEYYQLKSEKINVWAIVLIILVSGIIGGFARTKYDLLDSLFEKLKIIQNSVNQQPPLQNMQSLTELNQSVLALNESIEIVKEENNQKIFVNIIFGIIASSLSFLALTTFSSKILDFKTEVDYFVFLGWCLLGAVFAKNWIESLYNRITTNKN